MDRPVFIIAFANAPVGGDSYLRALDREQQRLRDVLERPENRGDWEVVWQVATRLGDLLDAFQKPQWRGRIAFLHYGGHGEPGALRLVDGAGGTQPISAARLAAFFKEQPGLQFVFLNACHTERFAEELRAVGLPAVVATSRAVKDAVATEFAARFYGALVGGSNLRSAFQQAEAVCRLLVDESFERTVRDGEPDLKAAVTALRKDGRWPWFVDATAVAQEWSLVDATKNPLFGVPPLPNIPIPSGSPYRGLARFERAHAGLFFGRASEIAVLYRQLAAHKPAITLLHGASGTGKSSLLEAGLLPRLEGHYHVIYLRRTRERGLAGDLLAALKADSATLAQRWREIEQDLPVLVVLDQVEETITRSRDSDINGQAEWRELADALKPLFGTGVKPPCGKLFLSCRKDYLPEIVERVKAFTDSFESVFVPTLGRAGVLEAINGPATLLDAGGSQVYPLEVSAGVADGIVEKLVPDHESPLAPMLQILLADLWDAAGAVSRTEARVITLDLLRERVDRGIGLRVFIQNQLRALETKPSQAPATTSAIRAGLALDLLNYHVTPEITADTHTADKIAKAYGADKRPAVRDTVSLLIDSRLLSGTTAAGTTRLAHDALAPLVRNEADTSRAPGARAQRILGNWRSNWAGVRGAARRLGWKEWIAVKRGRRGMRLFTPDEKRLLNRSYQYYLLSSGLAVVVLLCLAFGIKFGENKINGAVDAKKQADSMRQYEKALEQIAASNLPDAFAYLDRSLFVWPENRLAADCAFGLLTQQNLPLPLAGPFSVQSGPIELFKGAGDRWIVWAGGTSTEGASLLELVEKDGAGGNRFRTEEIKIARPSEINRPDASLSQISFNVDCRFLCAVFTLPQGSQFLAIYDTLDLSRPIAGHWMDSPVMDPEINSALGTVAGIIPRAPEDKAGGNELKVWIWDYIANPPVEPNIHRLEIHPAQMAEPNDQFVGSGTMYSLPDRDLYLVKYYQSHLLSTMCLVHYEKATQKLTLIPGEFTEREDIDITLNITGILLASPLGTTYPKPAFPFRLTYLQSDSLQSATSYDVSLSATGSGQKPRRAPYLGIFSDEKHGNLLTSANELYRGEARSWPGPVGTGKAALLLANQQAIVYSRSRLPVDDATIVDARYSSALPLTAPLDNTPEVGNDDMLSKNSSGAKLISESPNHLKVQDATGAYEYIHHFAVDAKLVGCLSSDGTMAAAVASQLTSTGTETTYVVWDVRTGKEIRYTTELNPSRRASYTMPLSTAVVVAATFLDNNMLLALVFDDGEVRLIDWKRNQLFSQPVRLPHRYGYDARLSKVQIAERLNTIEVTSFDGYGYRVDNIEFSVGPSAGSAPESFRNLLVLLGGKRFDDNGNPVDLVAARKGIPLTIQLRELGQSLPAGSGPFDKTMRWFFADRATRTISPTSSVRVPDYWDTLYSMGAVDECDLLAFGDVLRLKRLEAKLEELQKLPRRDPAPSDPIEPPPPPPPTDP